MVDESFKASNVSEDEIEGMKRVIFQNGGKVVDKDAKANFVIYEDGWDPLVWQNNLMTCGDSLNRNVVHYRWIEACIKENMIFDH